MSKNIGHYTDEEMIENVGSERVGYGMWIFLIVVAIPWLVGVGVLVCEILDFCNVF